MAQLRMIKASSLIESLIAMVIIVACFSIAVLIYASVIDSDKQLAKMKAILWMSDEFQATKENHHFVDEEKNRSGAKLIKTVKLYSAAENIYLITIQVNDADGNVIAKENHLIPEYE